MKKIVTVVVSTLLLVFSAAASAEVYAKLESKYNPAEAVYTFKDKALELDIGENLSDIESSSFVVIDDGREFQVTLDAKEKSSGSETVVKVEYLNPNVIFAFFKEQFEWTMLHSFERKAKKVGFTTVKE